MSGISLTYDGFGVIWNREQWYVPSTYLYIPVCTMLKYGTDINGHKPVCTWYILFTRSMYSVNTFFLKYVPVCTRLNRSKMFDFEYVLEEKSMYRVQGHKMVCTGMYQVHTSTSLFQYFGTSFISFLKGTSVHILVFSEYILSCP